MNEQAINDLYNLAKQNGYTKSLDEFVNLMYTNDNAFNDMYSLAKNNGYQKSQDDFSVLIGKKKSEAQPQPTAQAQPMAQKPQAPAAMESSSGAPSSASPSTEVIGEEFKGFDEEALKRMKASATEAPQMALMRHEKKAEKQREEDRAQVLAEIETWKDYKEQPYFEGELGNTIRAIPFGLGGFIDDMGRAVGAGATQADLASPANSLMISGASSSPEQIKKYVEVQKVLDKYGPSEEMVAFTKAIEEDNGGAWGFIKGLIQNPSVVPEVMISSVRALLNPTSAAAAGTVVGGAAAGGSAFGGVGAGPAALASIPWAMSAAGATLETASSFAEFMNEELQKRGLELSEENVKTILEDENALSRMRNRALTRGATVTVFDGFTGRIAGRVGANLGKGAGMASKIKAGLASAGIEAVGGSAGEATARALAGQEMDIAEIGLEGVGEMPMATIDVAAEVLRSPRYKINGEVRNAEDVQSIINTASADELQKINFDIKNDRNGFNQQIQDKIVTNQVRNEIKDASPDIDDESLNQLTTLEMELRKVEGNKTQTGRDKANQIRSQIREVQQAAAEKKAAPSEAPSAAPSEAKPLELEKGNEIKWNVFGNEPESTWTVGEKVKTRGGEDAVELSAVYVESSADGTSYTKEYADANNIKYDNERTVTHIVPLTDLQTLKTTQDAIQVEAAGQVPVQPTARPSEEVAQGKPKAEPQVTAQAGVEEEVVSPTMTLEEQVTALESMLTDDESAQFMLGGKKIPDNVTISDAIDEEGKIDYDAEEKVKKIAKDRGIGITRDREISFVARDENNNVIGGAFTSYDGDKYTFDIVIDKEYDGKGVGSELLNRVVNIPYELLEQNPNATIEVDVVSPVMQEMLKKRGFEVTRQVSEGRVIMEPKNKAQFMLESQQSQAKQEMIDEATKLMEQEEKNGFSEKAFDATNPEPTVKPISIEIKENTRLADKVKRMGLKELIGKKINLVMADQLKVGDVSIGKKILKRMGGPFFPLIDELFGKVAWASINKSAASSIVNGAIKSDYTVVYNMNPSAIDSNAAIRDTFIAMVRKMPKDERDAIVSKIVNQIKGKKFGPKTEQVQKDILKVKTLSNFEKMMSDLDVDTKAKIINMILPSKDVKAETEIGLTLQGKGITIESIREMNIEQFVADLPAGALTMVIEVQDKNGNKITEATKEEAIITPEQQKEEGLPSHDNYPIYIRGKAVAILSETVPFWNILKDSLNTINVKVAKIVKETSGRAFTAKEARSAEMRSASMTASTARKVSDVVATEYEKFVSLLSRAFPTVEVVANQKEFDKLIDELGAKKLLTKDQNVYGAVYNGKVYLNPSLENYNTPIHEFGHIWLNVAKNVNPELYKKGLSLVSNSPYIQQIKDNKDYQRVIKNMMKEGASESEIDTYIKEEALATAIGDRGESFVIAAQQKNFKEWLNKLYSVVRKLTGISKYTAEQLETITFDEFTKAVAVDLMSGNEIFTKLQVKEFSKQLQLSTGKKDGASIVKIGRASGFSEDAIRTVLVKKGFTEQEADALMSKPEAGKKIELGKELMEGYDKMMAEVDAIIERGLNRNAKQETILANVLKSVENSDAYKNGTDIQREQIVREVKQAFGEKMKSAPSVSKILGKQVDKVTMTEMSLLKKQLKDLARGARDAKTAISNGTKAVTERLDKMVKSGSISSAQLKTIIKKFGSLNVLNEKSLNRFIDYMTKVIADAEYSSKLENAQSLRKAIKKLSRNKEKNASMRELAKRFVDIDPSLVDDIDAYNDIAQKIKESVKGSTIREGKITQAEMVNIEDSNEYISETMDAQRQKLFDEKAAEIQELLGVDVSDLSYEQLLEMVDKKEKITKYNEGLVRSAIIRMFGTYSSIIEQMFSTSKDPFTGEDIDIDPKKKELVQRFMDMDLNQFTAKQGLEAVDALTNFIQNGSTAKMEAVVSEYTGEKNAMELEEKGVKSESLKAYWSKGIGRFFGEQFMSLPVLLDRMFKGVKKASLFEKMSGLIELRNKKSAADRKVTDIINDYVDKFYKEKANGEDFNTSYNATERGLVAFMTRNVIGTAKQMAEEFARRKALIEESIEVLSKGTNDEKAKAELYQKAYEKLLKDSNNGDEVRSKADSKNLEAIDYWKNKWAEIYDDLSDVSENVYNTLLDKDLNYTPDRYTRLDSAGERTPLENDQSMFHGNTNTIYKKKTGVLMEAERPKQLPRFEGKKKAGMYVDLSFDRNNANSMYDALVDINTAATIRQVQAFINSESFDSIIDNPKDAKLLKGRIQQFVRNMRDKNIVESDELSKMARSLNVMATIGVGQALGGVFQPFKQTIPVIVNTMINAGKINMSVPFTSAVNDFLNNSGYAIANRGLASSTEISSIEKLADLGESSLGEKALKKIEAANKKMLEILLVKADIAVARASWIAYYEKSLQEQGIDTKGIDYTTHELNKEAADYAQRMVDRQQNISDHDLAGKMFTSKAPMNQLFVKAVMPFASFRINQWMRMTTDLSTLKSKTATKEDKRVAARSLAGFTAEMFTFKLISFGLIVLMGTLTKALMGHDEDEEEEKKRIANAKKGVLTGTVTDVFSPVPFADKAIQMGGAWLLDKVQSIMDIAEEEKVSIYGTQKSDIFTGLGSLGIAGERLYQMVELISLSTNGKFKDDYGNEKQVSEQDMEVLKAMIGLSILSTVGLAPAEVNTIVRNSIKFAKKGGKTEKSIKAEQFSPPNGLTKEQFKRYFPEEYEEKYGEGSMYYKMTQPEREQKKKAEDEKQKLMDEYYDYEEKSKKGFGSKGFGEEKKKKEGFGSKGFGSKGFGEKD